MSVYVGIDVHRKRSQVAVIDQAGEMLANRNVVGADYSSALVRRHFDTGGGCRRAGPVGGHRGARSAQDR
jgi:hypothetical protein